MDELKNTENQQTGLQVLIMQAPMRQDKMQLKHQSGWKSTLNHISMQVEGMQRQVNDDYCNRKIKIN